MVGKLLSAGALSVLAVTALPAAAADQAVTFGTARVYAPSTVHVVAGESVTFTPDPGNDFATNGGSEHHPLDFVDPSIPDQTSGDDPVSRTFTKPGTYTFFCRNHGAAAGSGMAGTVVVDAPAGAPPTQPSPPPTPAPAPPATPTPPPTVPAQPRPTARDTTRPTVTLMRVTVRGLRHRSAAVRFISSEAGSASAVLSVRGTVLASGTKTANASGPHVLTLSTTTTSGRRLLRHTPRVRAHLRFTLTDAAGNVAHLSRRVTVRA